MKQGWEIKTIDEACSVEYGTRVVNKRDGGTKYPVYGGGGATFFMDSFNRENCFVIARFAMSEQCTRFIKGKFFLNDSGLSVKPKNFELIEQDFLNLQLHFLNDYIYSLGKGSAQRNLDVPAFRNIKIKYPKSLAEQQRIVAILNEAFDAIARAKANAEQNLKNARELFESYLRKVFKEGTIATTIGDQILLQRGFDITKSQQDNGSVPVVSSGGIKSFHNVAMVQAPGVVIGRKGTLGKVFYLEDDFWPHDTTLWVKDFRGNNARFVYYFFVGLDVKSLDSGAANPALNRNQVHPIIVNWSPIEIQDSIVQKLDALSSETLKLKAIYQEKIADLDDLKKSLLQKAFNGELQTFSNVTV